MWSFLFTKGETHELNAKYLMEKTRRAKVKKFFWGAEIFDDDECMRAFEKSLHSILVKHLRETNERVDAFQSSRRGLLSEHLVYLIENNFYVRVRYMGQFGLLLSVSRSIFRGFEEFSIDAHRMDSRRDANPVARENLHHAKRRRDSEGTIAASTGIPDATSEWSGHKRNSSSVRKLQHKAPCERIRKSAVLTRNDTRLTEACIENASTSSLPSLEPCKSAATRRGDTIRTAHVSELLYRPPCEAPVRWWENEEDQAVPVDASTETGAQEQKVGCRYLKIPPSAEGGGTLKNDLDVDYNIISPLLGNMFSSVGTSDMRDDISRIPFGKDMRLFIVVRIREALMKIFGSNLVLGPTTLEELARMSESIMLCSARSFGDRSQVVAPSLVPNACHLGGGISSVLCGFQSTLLGINISKLAMWERANLKPLSGPVHIRYVAVAETDDMDVAIPILLNVGAMYTACNFGCHTPVSDAVLKPIDGVRSRNDGILEIEACSIGASDRTCRADEILEQICSSIVESSIPNHYFPDLRSRSALVVYVMCDCSSGLLEKLVESFRNMNGGPCGGSFGLADRCLVWPKQFYIIRVPPKEYQSVMASSDAMMGAAFDIYTKLGSCATVEDGGLRVTRSLSPFILNAYEQCEFRSSGYASMSAATSAAPQAGNGVDRGYVRGTERGADDDGGAGSAQMNRTIHVCYKVISPEDQNPSCVACFSDECGGSVTAYVRSFSTSDMTNGMHIHWILKEASKMLVAIGADRASTALGGDSCKIIKQGAYDDRVRSIIALCTLGDALENDRFSFHIIKDGDHAADVISFWSLHEESIILVDDAPDSDALVYQMPDADNDEACARCGIYRTNTTFIAQRKNPKTDWITSQVPITDITDIHCILNHFRYFEAIVAPSADRSTARVLSMT